MFPKDEGFDLSKFNHQDLEDQLNIPAEWVNST